MTRSDCTSLQPLDAGRETTVAVSTMGRPDRERTEIKGKTCFLEGNSPSGLSCRAALIVPSASALRPRGLGVRTESSRAQSFCFKSMRT